MKETDEEEYGRKQKEKMKSEISIKITLVQLGCEVIPDCHLLLPIGLVSFHPHLDNYNPFWLFPSTGQCNCPLQLDEIDPFPIHDTYNHDRIHFLLPSIVLIVSSFVFFLFLFLSISFLFFLYFFYFFPFLSLFFLLPLAISL